MSEFAKFIKGVGDIDDIDEFIAEAEMGARMVAESDFEYGEITDWTVEKGMLRDDGRCVKVLFEFEVSKESGRSGDRAKRAFYKEVNPVYDMLLPSV